MTEYQKIEQAKHYLEKLAYGVDPFTGQKLRDYSTLNQVELTRCFFYVADILDRVMQTLPIESNAEAQSSKLRFKISEEKRRSIPISHSKLKISEFTQVINKHVNDPSRKKLAPATISNWLFKKGFLIQEIQPNGTSSRIPTAEGNAIGLTAKKSRGLNGEYIAVYYNSNAQRFIVDHLDSILSKE